ncbi:hypothetical protein CROQUDRAFT_102541 [Cronartium quercuum f. sp. fusiforme G11]|uniref:Uncharacterized protein n=1 Tax=Cronartium quercuum f. sp. fusiforme G11 TaxID=708437 RepID=A0A9P6T505_9BASI|nr:hypothetical protein CROQUDRAFT_102541 [Cronartium quercuum f. sp. fusiforme G11]
MSDFLTPPTQLPINFYSPAWFNKLPPGQKEEVANSHLVALLPNAAESLLPPYELIIAAKSDDESLEKRGDINV